ncbi:uncharacterized protein BDR25DRAFT_354587 [Lindgomyces ingoldianus]|uniref:Uncharacterized protein n=1 Tax=Lindgomyces ingoldianus TaxID=673940 RepID=A0ACB6QWT9_9PLEO|nr:uncharacterized protein BDR25DRAFT_354587 [Lindgomyces ingoldianus]KAF2471345.1 hypothetical protein BDR25DRAFT_354587 [Lindgomyces ingoldianus]
MSSSLWSIRRRSTPLAASGFKDRKVAQATAFGRDKSNGKYTRVLEARNWTLAGLKARKWALRAGTQKWFLQGAQGQTQALLRAAQTCSSLLRLGAGLHRHSSVSLTHGSGFNTGCSGLKTEMDFGEVKIRVWWLSSRLPKSYPRQLWFPTGSIIPMQLFFADSLDQDDGPCRFQRYDRTTSVFVVPIHIVQNL